MKKLFEYEDNSFWCPVATSTLDKYLAKYFTGGVENIYVYPLRRNIAYSLQYFQFQMKLLQDVPLHSVIQTQTYKTSIIVGMGIVEAFLYYLIVKNKKYTPKLYSDEATMKVEQSRLLSDKNYYVSVKMFPRLEKPIMPQLKFNEMLKIAQKEKLLGSSSNPLYPLLSYLKEMRNKVHLQNINHGTSHDWNNFNLNEMQKMKEALYLFMTCSYLKPTSEEKKVFDYLL
jgi:hypothetical protein